MNANKTLYSVAVTLLMSVAGVTYAAQFWQGYCDTEGKTLGGWSNQEKVAQQNADHHKRSNSDHSVSVNSK